MTIKNINSETLAKWLKSGEAVLIDVREKSENDVEKIEGSILIPLRNINLNSLPDFASKKLVIHCRSGKRSLTACEKLVAEDSNLEIYNLEGGIEAWKASGSSINSCSSSKINVMQQVKLIAGTLIATGLVLGFICCPSFFLLSIFVSCGLIYAKISGNCYLAKALEKMPWNK